MQSREQCRSNHWGVEREAILCLLVCCSPPQLTEDLSCDDRVEGPIACGGAKRVEVRHDVDEEPPSIRASCLALLGQRTPRAQRCELVQLPERLQDRGAQGPSGVLLPSVQGVCPDQDTSLQHCQLSPDPSNCPLRFSTTTSPEVETSIFCSHPGPQQERCTEAHVKGGIPLRVVRQGQLRQAVVQRHVDAQADPAYRHDSCNML
mmetsp:Transcript_109993/g.275517  ORF Transcript_109993/g.275517 Transcript_109993/m.275517 type:complete len:205 (-) Transcript_109993:629-1243(-)